MRNVHKPWCIRGWTVVLRFVVAGCIAIASAAFAQPTNDNFANAIDLTGFNGGFFGSVTNNMRLATGEAGEPNHAGFPAFSTVWYKWTATNTAEVQLDTLSSTNDTILAVYTGPNLTTLRQVAANDDAFPYTQPNRSGLNFYTQPFNGPSALRFNAKAGITYYFSLSLKSASVSTNAIPVILGWSYHAAGVFRFATEDAVTITTRNTNTIPPTFSSRVTPVYQCSENESSASEWTPTVYTYYTFGVPGTLVTVTRLAGSTGRMLVDYATETPTNLITGDAAAIPFLDYVPVQGTLVFDDYEMTKRIMIPIISDFGMTQSNRDFAVVLTNARPDVAESPLVAPPRIDGGYGRCLVRILDADLDPRWASNLDTNGVFTVTTNTVVNFARATYRTTEDVGAYWTDVLIDVVRSTAGPNEGISVTYRINNYLRGNFAGDEEDNNMFPLQPGSDYATPTPPNSDFIRGTNSDFALSQGTLTWAANDYQSKQIHFTIPNDQLTEFNEDFHIFLYTTQTRDGDTTGNPKLVGTLNETCITVLFDDQDPPAGSVDQLHNADFGAHMVPPVTTTGDANRAHPGTDSSVYSLVVQPDNKTVIAGDFATFNATSRGRIARMNLDGSVDTTFTPGAGANDFINSIVRTASGQFIIGGGFSSYNGTPRARVARLNASGTLDGTFNPVAPDGTVWAVAAQSDGKVIIAGDFTSVGGIPRAHIARFNSTGSLDMSFDPGATGPDGTIWAIALQADGKIVIGGSFSRVGARQPAGGIARLNLDGTPDTSFTPGAGTDGTIYALALQSDGKILIGGSFSLVDFNPRNNLSRLDANGFIDLTFDPASLGANGPVYSILPVSGGIYIGGQFTSFNGTHRMGLARLYVDGTVDTSFLDTAYNQFAGLHRARFSDSPGIVFAAGVQSDGNVMIAGSFEQVGGGQNNDAFVRPDTMISTNAFSSQWNEPKSRDGVRNRRNVARLIGGATPGPGNIGLTVASDTANENGTSLSVQLTRSNGSLGFMSANFEVEEGLAQAGVDYIYNSIPPIYLSSWRLGRTFNIDIQASEANSTTRMHSDGLFGDNFVPTSIFGQTWNNYSPGYVVISLLDNGNSEGDRNTTLRLANPTAADQFYLGGENIPLGGALGLSQAPFTILDDDKNKGTVSFASANFVVNEGVTNAQVTIIRTNGSSGSLDCQFTTIAGGTATSNGADYYQTNRQIHFGPGVTTQYVSVVIVDDINVEPDETISLRLTGPITSGASFGLTNAVITIVDNDTPGGKLNFSSATYSTNENVGAAVITVTRSGSSVGTLTVQVGATNGTAISGVDFTGVTNLLTWGSGDLSPKTITIPLNDDATIEPDETVNLRLFNPTLNGSPNAGSLGPTSTAVLTILNDDFTGQLSFSTTVYNANENGGPAIITVVRVGGSSESVAVNFSASGGTAVAGFDFTPTNGTLSFGPGELSKSFAVPIINNAFGDSARFVTLTLSGFTPPGSQGFPTTSVLNIIDDESVNTPAGQVDTEFNLSGANDAVFALALQSDGKIIAGGDFTVVNSVPKVRLVRLNAANGSVDDVFKASANGTVRSLIVQADGRVLVGGAFTTINNISRNHIARVNSNGSLDTSFNPGPGTDNPIFAVAEAFVGGQRKIYIGGSFTTFDGNTRNAIARLTATGGLDTSFAPSLGANGTVFAIAAYPTNTTDAGKVLIAGDFTTVNGVGRGHIARLNSDGSLDTSFDPGAGAGDSVRAVAIQLDGRILIGGSFTNYNGTTINRFARLNANGSLDATFTVGDGADDTVDAITIQGDTRIVLGGLFKHANGVNRNHITRLNNNGTVDPTINFGAGANNFVAATLVQPDGKIVIGGGFTEYDGIARQRIARIYGGSVAGSGTLEFAAKDYGVSENTTNATLTVRRRGGTSGTEASANVSADVVITGGSAINGVNYIAGTTTVTFPPGEVFQTIQLAIIDDFEINPDRTVEFELQNLQPPGVPALGNQPTATLTITNDDSAISFDAPTYAANENVLGGVATIRILRTGSTAGTAAVDFLTTTNGTATPGVDFTMVTNTVVFNEGEALKTVFVAITNDLVIEDNETISLVLSNATGALLLAPFEAVLTIVDDESAPGQIAFGSPTFVVGENQGNAAITLIRTNGKSGTISVTLSTSDVTATAGLDYTPVNLPVSFDPGETNKTVLIPINNDGLVEGSEVFNVTLSNFGGGATLLGASNAPVTIIDDDAGVTFSAPTYLISEAGPSITIGVLRINGSNGIVSVNYTTTNATAIAGLDYTATSGTLVFSNNETIKSFTIPIIDDSLVEGDETFNVVLSNPTPGLAILNGNAGVTILDNDPGLGFLPASYVVSEAGTNVVLTVVRTNASTGTIAVTYGSTNGTATAGADYTAVAGVLTFTNGETVKTITVPIANDTEVEGNENFTVTLSNPTGGAQISGAAVADITVTDNDSGLQFSSANYAAIEGGVAATITVLRTGVLTNTVTVDYSTSDLTATNLSDYVAASGTLVFTNGETSKSFTVTVIDDTIEEGSETVSLKLSNPTGQASLLTPNAATLTIVDNDGGAILPAGVLLTSESGPVNGAVEPGETVTALFAMRNISGLNTTNLVATLLTTNGVTVPSGAQNYGALASGGASVSRPFTFTAAGTNGGTVSATFQLQDGALNYGRVTFNFLLGSSSAVFSNLAPIVINDMSNGLPAAATPYPSVINVAGLGGTVSKVVVTLTNVAHGHPADVDVLLVNPAAQRMVLMSDAGNGVITNVTLTFDDAAATSLPSGSLVTSGTNKPTNYLLGDLFPSPAPPEPYGSTLSALNGSNPNGAWSLYVVDDAALDIGSIGRGWYLYITTSGVIPAAVDLSVTVNPTPLPAIVGSNLTYTVLVTNHGPWSASGVTLTNILPANANYISSSAGIGSISTNGGGLLVWNIGTLAKDGSASASITVRPNVAGPMTSVNMALASQADPNADNNNITNLVVVATPTADLVTTVVDSPDPVIYGQNLTFSIFVTNVGPATATSVSVTNWLPAGMAFLSATPSGYTLVGNVVTFTNLGNLGSGALGTASITVHPNVAGTFTNTTSSGSDVVDPLKANNTVAVKTVVEFPPLSTFVAGNTLVIAWPAEATAYSLESATNLTPPAIWTPVTVPPPVIIGGQKVITNIIGPGSKFFRLRATLP